MKKICPVCFNLIGDDTRMKILCYLKKNPQKAGEIGKHFSLAQPTISHHLKELRKTGLVLSRKKGREIYYFLNKKYACKKCFILKTPFKI